MRALVILNGDFGEITDGYDLTLCCDGAYDRVGNARIDAVIGDLDSVTRPIIVPIVHLPCEKDLTDGEAAVREAARRGADEVDIVGAFGGERVDQILTNLTLLGTCCELGVRARILTERAMLTLVCGEAKFENTGFRYFSLVPLFGSAHIKVAEGLKYPIRDLELDGCRSIGVSNEPTQNMVSLTVDRGKILVVMQF